MSLERSVSNVTELFIKNQSAFFLVIIHSRELHHFLDSPNLSTPWERDNNV